MKTKAANTPNRKGSAIEPVPARSTVKGTAVPVRFDAADREMIDDLSKRTGLSGADVVRRALRFAAPKFQSGAVNIADLTESAAPAKKVA